MVLLAMVVPDELGERAPKVTLTERDHTTEALLFDRPYGPLRISVAVGRNGQADRSR